MKRVIVTTDQLIISSKKTDLLCNFYGYTHPKCKKAIKRDVFLYEKYLEQFKVPPEENNSQKVNEE
jgi:hypothetical protein